MTYMGGGGGNHGNAVTGESGAGTTPTPTLTGGSGYWRLEGHGVFQRDTLRGGFRTKHRDSPR